MGQSVCHVAAVTCSHYLLVYFRMVLDIGMGTIYPERHLKLIVGQRPIYLGRMVAADETAVLLIAFLPMIRHVDDNSVLVAIALDNLVDHGVIIESGIIIITKHLTLARGQFRTFLLVLACPKM